MIFSAQYKTSILRSNAHYVGTPQLLARIWVCPSLDSVILPLNYTRTLCNSSFFGRNIQGATDHSCLENYSE